MLNFKLRLMPAGQHSQISEGKQAGQGRCLHPSPQGARHLEISKALMSCSKQVLQCSGLLPPRPQGTDLLQRRSRWIAAAGPRLTAVTVRGALQDVQDASSRVMTPLSLLLSSFLWTESVVSVLLCIEAFQTFTK